MEEINSRTHNSKALRGNLLLLLTAFIWGVAFVAQSVGMDYVGPFTFNASRNYIAPLVLLPVIISMTRKEKKKPTADDYVNAGSKDRVTAGQNEAVGKYAGANNFKSMFERKGGFNLIVGGIVTGCALTFGSCMQQIGIQYTSVGKSGFITAMYILIVPILGLFFGKKVSVRIWGCVVIALAGLYMLCMTGSFSLQFGDIMLLLCALGFSIQILAIDYFSPRVDGVCMSAIQFLVCALISTILALIFEKPDLASLLAAWKPILYAGALSSAVGYTLQIIAQKDTDPVIASLLMSLESAFSLLAGWVILGQHLSGRELFGCALMFIAIMVSQMPDKKARK